MIKGLKIDQDEIFYYVSQDLSSQSYSMMELRVSENNDTWVTKQRPIFQAISGQVLALELDYNKAHANEKNQLFIVDQSPSVIHLIQPEDKTELYETLNRFSLSEVE